MSSIYCGKREWFGMELWSLIFGGSCVLWSQNFVIGFDHGLQWRVKALNTGLKSPSRQKVRPKADVFVVTTEAWEVLGMTTNHLRSSDWYQNHLSRHRNSHYKDKPVVRPSHFYNGNSYTGKTKSLYRNSPQNRICHGFVLLCFVLL